MKSTFNTIPVCALLCGALGLLVARPLLLWRCGDLR